MTLPVVISTTEEALRRCRILSGWSAFLGATHWQTIWRESFLQKPCPGILTGVILGLERAAGKPRPSFYRGSFLTCPPAAIALDATMALPYHIFVISTPVPGMPLTDPVRHGAGAAGLCAEP